MISCLASDDRFQCPPKWAIWRQILGLLPRGRAWQTHEQVLERQDNAVDSEVGVFEVDVTPIGIPPTLEKLTVMQQFWAAYAEVLAALHERACALLDEMVCDTVKELRDDWLAIYGLPDGCAPWNSICDKVNAVGGSRADYFIGLAAELGWVITISECKPGARTGCARAGCARACGCPRDTIFVDVLLAVSPAFANPVIKSARAGSARAGAAVAGVCPVGAEQIVCLIERFKPAHIKAVFSFDGVPL